MDIFITLFFSLFLSTIGATDVSVPNTPTNTPIVHEFNRDRVAIASRQEREIPIYDIPLTKEIQEYIYTYSNKKDISPTMVYAIIKLESAHTFDPSIISKDGNDYGLMQWNKPSGTFDWLKENVAQELNIPVAEISWDNPIHNVTGGIWYLDWLRNYWINRGITSQETLFDYVLASYNMGIGNMQGYIKTNSPGNFPYVKVVSQLKYEIEMSEDNG